MNSRFIAKAVTAMSAAAMLFSGMPVAAAGTDGNGTQYMEMTEAPAGFQEAMYSVNPDGDVFINSIDANGQYLQTWDENGNEVGQICVVDANNNVLNIENPTLINVGDETYLNLEVPNGTPASVVLTEETMEALKSQCDIDGIYVNGVLFKTFSGEYNPQALSSNVNEAGHFDKKVETVVYDANNVRITVSEVIDQGDTIEMKFRVENNRSTFLFCLNQIPGDSNKQLFYVNGYAIEPEKIEYEDGAIPAGGVSEITVRFNKGDLTGRGINEMSTINAALVLYEGTFDRGNAVPTNFLDFVLINLPM